MARGKYQDWLTDEGLLKLEGWARDGLVDEQIAKNIGIRRETLYAWEKKYPNISNALKKGKEVVDRQVENALLKRALGFNAVDHSYKVVDVEDGVLWARRKKLENKYKLSHPDASEEEIEIYANEHVETRERIELFQNEREVPPDTTAAIFWLKNRKPDDWRDRKETQLTGNITTNAEYQKLTTEELRRLASDDGA